MSVKPQHELKAGEAKVEMQVIVRDKYGNVKYQGPLVMNATLVKEKEDGGNTSDTGQNRDR